MCSHLSQLVVVEGVSSDNRAIPAEHPSSEGPAWAGPWLRDPRCLESVTSKFPRHCLHKHMEKESSARQAAQRQICSLGVQ